MKEVEVHSWCDGNHSNADGRIEAVIERTITVNGSHPILLDLCAAHDRQLTDLMERGAEIPASTRPAPKASSGRKPIQGPHICPVCGHEHASRNAMTKHVRSAHNTTIKELDADAQVSAAG